MMLKHRLGRTVSLWPKFQAEMHGPVLTQKGATPLLQSQTHSPSQASTLPESQPPPAAATRVLPPRRRPAPPRPPEMDTSEVAAKLSALEDDISAMSSRITQLEARVSLLEAENARLRKPMPEGEAMDRTGSKGPGFGRLEEGLGGNKQKPVGMVGGGVVYDVIEVSDDGEERMAVDVSEAVGAKEGVLVVPTPRKCAGRVVPSESGDEDEIEESGGGGGGDNGSVHYDDNAVLEDDDVQITPRGKKRTATRMITTDSEDEDGNGKDGEVQEKEVVGVTPSRKRALRGVSDSEDGSEGARVVSLAHASSVAERDIESADDDGMPIREWVKKMRQERLSRDEDGLDETKEYSTPATRHSARLLQNQSKRVRSARRMLDFVEPKDCERSEDDSEEDDGMDKFIDDADCSDNSVDSAEESSAEPEECYSEPDYQDVMARIRGKRKAKSKDWASEPEMLSAFAEHPELCLKAVCALYRRQTAEEQTEKATFVHNKEGFNQIDAPRASRISEFLLDSDGFGPLKKTANDLKNYDLEFCHKMALRYSKQLFTIYQNKEDPYFP